MRQKLSYLFIAIALLSMIIVAKPHDKNATSKMPPTIVVTTQPKIITYQDTLQATGSLAAMESTMITSETTGRIAEIHFRSGQFAKKSQLLVELDDAILQAQLEKTAAKLHLSQTNYERFLKLYKQKFFSEAELDKVKATLASDKADVETIQAQIKETRIRAPFDGKLGLKQVSIGDYVKPGASIVNLQALRPIRVDFSVPETYFEQIKTGNKITIQSQAFLDQTYTGTIYALDASIDKSTRTLEVRAKIPNQSQLLLPGTFVEVTIYLNASKPTLVIPQTAVMYARDGDYVYTMVDRKAVKTKITLGKKLKDNQVIVSSGLKPQDQVITEGQIKIHEGATVMTAKEAEQMFKVKK